ncbi:MAG: Rieske 2Fe-2S domain-containing protein [Candidatus Binataceae bacterium]|nr:Rieske 2Fe-2S domain-containing protein [Candidatus Binataceae bacterium]
MAGTVSRTSNVGVATGGESSQRRTSRSGYIKAKFGFRNYWYPAIFSRELTDKPVGVRLLGENILIRRVGDRAMAVADQCLHRGVRFSRKPECYTADTITCWYHGFTYSFTDGKLVEILTEPGSSLIGKLALKTYPVSEAKGIVFVFVGDREPGDLAHDVAPNFLDPDLEIDGIRDEVASNWRLGAENGFDTTHIYIHRDSVLVPGNNLALPLGLVPGDLHGISVYGENEPKGVLDHTFENYQPVFEGKIDGQTVARSKGIGNQKIVAREVSIWMPGMLKVDPFPDPSLIQFEWYVPIDGERHMYWRVLGQRVSDTAEADAFHQEFHNRWKSLALHGFNDEDIRAREGMQEFYQHDKAWAQEHLFKPDRCIVEWRKLASRHNRGIQPPANG